MAILATAATADKPQRSDTNIWALSLAALVLIAIMLLP